MHAHLPKQGGGERHVTTVSHRCATRATHPLTQDCDKEPTVNPSPRAVDLHESHSWDQDGAETWVTNESPSRTTITQSAMSNKGSGMTAQPHGVTDGHVSSFQPQVVELQQSLTQLTQSTYGAEMSATYDMMEQP